MSEKQPGAPVRRVLSGLRPTGALHLGHYVGALKLWLAAQQDPGLECFFVVADIQALTTHAGQPDLIRVSVRQVIRDWLAVGLDPSLPNVHFALQSAIPWRSDLSVLFDMIATLEELQRNPTIKTEAARLKKKKKPISMGFLRYPIDQAADILFVSPPNVAGNELLVPVGADQVPHLEYSRKLARRFNKKWGSVFRPCTPLVGEVPTLVGIDGQDKMGKSEGNAIMLGDSPEEVRQKVMGMYTDPNRIHPTDPGTVEGNPLFIYFDAFAPDKEEVAAYKTEYKRGRIGDVQLKIRLSEILNELLAPFHDRMVLMKDVDELEILRQGTRRASELSVETMAKVREATYLFDLFGTERPHPRKPGW